ncbi:MAG: universal stress protein [Chitinophagales bacterium]
MFNILFLTDFSENADTALKYACDLVEDKDGKITMFTSYIANKEQDKKSVLERLKKYQAKCPDIELEFLLEEGNTLENIQNCCGSNSFNLVVMGFKGVSDDSESNIGGVTSEVIRRVKHNILAVPENAAYKPIKKIAYALDYVDFKKETLEVLNTFAEKLNAEIILLHVSEVEHYIEEEKLQNYRQIMDSVVNFDNLSFEFITGADVGKAIEEYIDENNMDVLAMLTRDYHLIEKAYEKSLTRKILFHTKKPLLVFHE